MCGVRKKSQRPTAVSSLVELFPKLLMPSFSDAPLSAPCGAVRRIELYCTIAWLRESMRQVSFGNTIVCRVNRGTVPSRELSWFSTLDHAHEAVAVEPPPGMPVVAHALAIGLLLLASLACNVASAGCEAGKKNTSGSLARAIAGSCRSRCSHAKNQKTRSRRIGPPADTAHS